MHRLVSESRSARHSADACCIRRSRAGLSFATLTIVVAVPGRRGRPTSSHASSRRAFPIDGAVGGYRQPVGANGAVGSIAVARARPDGYTLVMAGVNTHGMNDSLIKPRPYDSAKDFAAITLTAMIPIAFVANSALPVATLQDLVALARAKPGQLSYGSSGAGGHSTSRWSFSSLPPASTSCTFTTRGGAPQLNDLIGGHILIGSIGLPAAMPHIPTGKLRPLAVTDAKRSVFLPGPADRRGGRLPGFRGHLLARTARAGGDAARHRRQTRRRSSAILQAPETRAALGQARRRGECQQPG